MTTDRERDCRIARGLGWTDIRGVEGFNYNHWAYIPDYSAPTQTGPLLEALTEKLGTFSLTFLLEAGEVSVRYQNEWFSGPLSEAVAELADKVLGVSDE